MIGNQHAEDLRRCCDALDAENKRLRGVLRKLILRFEGARYGAEELFRDSGETYHEGRKVAYDQAAADVRAALSGESKC